MRGARGRWWPGGDAMGAEVGGEVVAAVFEARRGCEGAASGGEKRALWPTGGEGRGRGGWGGDVTG
jgi:hypothetical protein